MTEWNSLYNNNNGSQNKSVQHKWMNNSSNKGPFIHSNLRGLVNFTTQEQFSPCQEKLKLSYYWKWKFLVFVRLPIYCVTTQFLKNISTFLSFFSFFAFSPAPLISILSPKYQYKMTNPLFFQYTFVTSSR